MNIDNDEQTITVSATPEAIVSLYVPKEVRASVLMALNNHYAAQRQALRDEVMGAVGEEDNSPMYFAELYEGQAKEAYIAREARNKLIAKLRTAISTIFEGKE